MLWIAAFIVLQFLDTATTLIGLLSGLAAESNPLALFLIESVGLAGYAAVKVVSVVAVVAWLSFAGDRIPRTAATAWGAVVAVSGVVVLNNLQVLT